MILKFYSLYAIIYYAIFLPLEAMYNNMLSRFESKDICNLVGTIFTSKQIILPSQNCLTLDELRNYLNKCGNVHYIRNYYACSSLMKCIELYSANTDIFNKDLIEEIIVANTNTVMRSQKLVKKVFELYETTSLLSIIFKRKNYYIDLLSASAVYAILNYKKHILIKILDAYSQSSVCDIFIDSFYRAFEDVHYFNYRLTESKYNRYIELFNIVSAKIPSYKLSTASQYSDFINEMYMIDADLSDVIPKKIDIIEQIECGTLWATSTRFPRVIEISFKYPNGKRGDVYKYICEKYGRVTQKDSLSYHAIILSKYKDEVIPLLCYISKDTNISQNVCGLFLPYVLDHMNYNSPMTYQFKIHKTIAKREIAIHNSFVNKTNELYGKIIIEHKSSPTWKSEFQLYTIAKQYFPDALYQYHSEWLKSQSLDIFIPSLAIGIEYQGKQHFEPIEHFGGYEGYTYTVERDLKKSELCKKHKITLIYWPYSTPISDGTFREELYKYGVKI